jgi:hypothetical protein
MALSATAPRVRPARVPATRAPRLTLLTAPEPGRSSIPFIALCTAVLVGALLAVLALNISMSHGSYELTRLQSEAGALTQRQQDLQQELELRQAPQNLAVEAQGLGMVPSGQPAFIDLATGEIVGEPVPAGERAVSDNLVAPPAVESSADAYYGLWRQ